MKIASIIAGAAVVAVAGVGVAGTAEAGQADYYMGGKGKVCVSLFGNGSHAMGTISGELVIDGKIERSRGGKRGFAYVVGGETGLKYTRKGITIAPYYGEGGVVKMKRVSADKFRAKCGGM